MLCNPETLYQVWFSVDRIDNTLATIFYTSFIQITRTKVTS